MKLNIIKLVTCLVIGAHHIDASKDFALFCQNKSCDIKNLQAGENDQLNFSLYKEYHETTRVRFMESKIHEMPTNLAEEMPSLMEIIANFCSLRKISVGAFGPHNSKHLINLEILNFENNKITVIDAGALAGAQNLRNLNLRFNHISELEDSAFHGLQKLEELSLDGNRLKMLPDKVFADLVSVENVYLTGNRLTMINMNLFSTTMNLATLSLADNLLTKIDFEEVPSMKHLHLDGNNFVSLDVKDIKSELPKLQTISVYKNNWNCKSLMQMIYQLRIFNIELWFPTDKHTKVYDQLNAYGIVCFTSPCEYTVAGKSEETA